MKINLPGNSEFTSDFFDKSSHAWMENKIRVGLSVQYRCCYNHSNGRPCKKPGNIQLNNENSYFCKQHYCLKLKSNLNTK